MDLMDLRSELVRLAGRMSDLAVEHAITQRMRDRAVLDLHRAGTGVAEIADLAGLRPTEVRRLVRDGGGSASRRADGPR